MPLADSTDASAIRTECPQALRVAGGSSATWGPPTLVAAIERVQSGLLGETLSSVGITGLYLTLVLGLGRFLRLALTNLRMRIPYQDLPNVAHLVALCNDIAAAREERELMLEEVRLLGLCQRAGWSMDRHGLIVHVLTSGMSGSHRRILLMRRSIWLATTTGMLGRDVACQRKTDCQSCVRNRQARCSPALSDAEPAAPLTARLVLQKR